MHYAGFWRRFAAACIDMLIYTPLYFLCRVLLPRPFWLADTVFILIALFTYAWLFASRHQGSPGMRVLGFKVVTTHGNRISYLRALAWGIAGTVGWLFVGAGLIYVQLKYNLDAINAYLYSGKASLTGPEAEQVFGTSLQEFMFWILISLGGFLGMALIWSFSIGLSREKTGFHNVLCGTRFVTHQPPPTTE